MLRTRIFALLCACFCLASAVTPALAAEVDAGSVYCFTPEDFSGEESVAGICITELPDSNLGAVMLGSRVLRPGDILTADQLAQMTFAPIRTEEDLSASVTYLPIYDDHVASEVTMTIAIRGKEDKVPVAEDSAHETYKNLPLDGKLKVQDPEGQAMTFTITRSPRRGEVTVNPDGSFTYTPKKNKVGTDSFTYTATDPNGGVSRQATVTVNIMKPTDATQYTDTVGRECRFAAEWMKNTGIFVGERVAGSACFRPDREVTRGEFVTMLVKALEIPVEEDAEFTGYTDEVPSWLRPYLAAAVRSGLTAGLPEGDVFGAETAITGAEAAVMLQNALDLTAADGLAEDVAAEEEELSADGEAAVPVWAESALTVMAGNGFAFGGKTALTREEAALCLYRAVQLADSAPGMRVIRAQQ